MNNQEIAQKWKVSSIVADGIVADYLAGQVAQQATVEPLTDEQIIERCNPIMGPSNDNRLYALLVEQRGEYTVDITDDVIACVRSCAQYHEYPAISKMLASGNEGFLAIPPTSKGTDRCRVCGEAEPRTGSCGSSDPAALCNLATSKADTGELSQLADYAAIQRNERIAFIAQNLPQLARNAEACITGYGTDFVQSLAGDALVLLYEYDGVLRGLASHLSAGGFNSEGLILPEVADAKIRHGIEHAIPLTGNTDVAKTIHYPECWDTAVYPTLRDAVSAIGEFRCSNDDGQHNTDIVDRNSVLEEAAQNFWPSEDWAAKRIRALKSATPSTIKEEPTGEQL